MSEEEIAGQLTGSGRTKDTQTARESAIGSRRKRRIASQEECRLCLPITTGAYPDRPKTWTHKLVQEYLSLGGRRLSKIDDNITEVADSDEAAPSFRDDCAPGFRDDLAPLRLGSCWL
jgi:hypothetical protein